MKENQTKKVEIDENDLNILQIQAQIGKILLNIEREKVELQNLTLALKLKTKPNQPDVR